MRHLSLIKNSYVYAAIVAVLCISSSLSIHAGEISLHAVDDLSEFGTSEEKLGAITEGLMELVESKKLAGIETLIAKDGKIVYESTLGVKGVEDSRPLESDDLFRIYSMTKPIAATALMQLYEKGKFELDDPITKFIPEFENLTVWQEEGEPVPASSVFTMRQLLSHTAGFTYTFTPHPIDQMYREQGVLSATNLEEMITKLSNIPLRFQPGERWHYSVAVDVTGSVVERISGQTLDVYLQEHIFGPLGMVDTFFGVPADKFDRFLPNHFWNRETQMLMQTPPQSFESFKEENVTFFSGGGGLVSTAMDYMRFCEAMRQGGSLEGARILQPGTVALMIENHLPASLTVDAAGESPGVQRSAGLSVRGFGLGFGINLDADDPSVVTSYFWGGAAGTVFWIDPVNNMSVVSLIQLMGSPHDLRGALLKGIASAWDMPYEMPQVVDDPEEEEAQEGE
ncbi:MAG: serine hydrolase [Gammaproteobacteria bacterium]|nr:serine hydrolase [Gammaproteobacteria bacterium]